LDWIGYEYSPRGDETKMGPFHCAKMQMQMLFDGSF
jgi:hypothetical protein